MNDYVIITVNGTDYYCPANYVKYITSDLINTSNTNITLYKDIYNNSNSQRYPRITLGSYSLPVYYSSSGTTGTNLSVQSVEFNYSAQFYRSLDVIQYIYTFLLFLIAVLLLVRRFKS